MHAIAFFLVHLFFKLRQKERQKKNHVIALEDAFVGIFRDGIRYIQTIQSRLNFVLVVSTKYSIITELGAESIHVHIYDSARSFSPYLSFSLCPFFSISSSGYEHCIE